MQIQEPPLAPISALTSLPALRENGLITLERFCELQYLEEDEDYIRPTQYAYSAALKIVTLTRDLMRDSFPEAMLTTTEKGGINWYWRKPTFSVQLTIASSSKGKDYIYVRDNKQALMHEEVSASYLAQWLQEYNRR